MKQKSSIMK